MSTKKDSLNKYYQTFYVGEDHLCQECGHQFTDEGNLNRHQKAMHECIQYQYQCKQCDYKASMKDTVTNTVTITSS